MLAQAHLFSTFAMTGVIWLVQLVHYPGLHRPGADAGFYGRNASRTGIVVVPLMLVEAVSSALLLFINHDVFHLVLALFLAMIWVVTAVCSVPCHKQLCRAGYSEDVVSRLVRTNWLRTLSWSARSALLLATL